MHKTTSSVRPSPLSNGNSNCFPKCCALIEDSKMVIASPTQIAERKKRKGSSGVYQKGCNLFGTIRYKLPSEDWCRVESMTPAITSGMTIAFCHLSSFGKLNFSNRTPENSSASTVLQSITH